VIAALVLLLASQAAALCEKACIAPRDARLIVCKTVRTSQPDCPKKAELEYRDCVSDCKAAAAEKTRQQSQSGSMRRSDRAPKKKK